MATQTSIFSPSSEGDLSATVGAGVSSAEIVVGNNRIFAINANGDTNIRFGTVGMAAASAANFRLPSGVTAQYDCGSATDRIRIFNPGGAGVTYWIQFLSRA